MDKSEFIIKVVLIVAMGSIAAAIAVSTGNLIAGAGI